MGSGKSSVGREISKTLGMNLIDTDVLIEHNEGIKISEMFLKHGESYFRNLETAFCKNILNIKDSVISTGGGIVLRDENIRHLRKNAIIFLLRADAETIYSRVKHSKDRPLLQVEDPLEKIKDMLRAREEKYSKSYDYEIITDGKSVFEIANEIKEIYIKE
jgi:shikimate kinase